MKALLTIILLITLSVSAQDTTDVHAHPIPGYDDSDRNDKAMRLVFYNVENLFDWEDDSLTRDESFTPGGDNHWNPKRFWDKQRKLSQTLLAIGGWEAPDIVGLCEIENRFVLEQLTTKTALKDVGYQIVHRNSSDSRGIDVGLIYRPEKFQLLYEEFIKVKFDDPEARTTRDILYVKGIGLKKDTLHIFVNHWPSRYGGHLATDPKRMSAAKTLKAKVDSITSVNPKANVILTGDFNDHPEDASILEGLKAKHKAEDMKAGDLFNLMHEKQHKEGTHKFQGEWGVLDMWFVSSGLYNGEGKFKLKENAATIFKAPWLLLEEDIHLGHKPYRTYQGPKYIGGYSDHLPIVLDIKLKE